MAMSGNRPETVHPPDDFRTVSGHCHLVGNGMESSLPEIEVTAFLHNRDHQDPEENNKQTGA